MLVNSARPGPFQPDLNQAICRRKGVGSRTLVTLEERLWLVVLVSRLLFGDKMATNT